MTSNHAHTAQSTRITVEEVANLQSSKRPLEPLRDEQDVPTIKDFLDIDGNIQRHLFPKGTHFLGDEEYDKTDNPFSDIYVAPGM